ncbi:MAG: hypothetical protein KA403_06165 [Candidatus Omnitrophica bacterium]|nr:hypothetical protein [Candidatus Omnitrophota bacterium]
MTNFKTGVVLRIGHRWFMLCLMLLLCFSLSGCALLKMPFQLLGQLFGIAQKVPTPPPWVFF